MHVKYGLRITRTRGPRPGQSFSRVGCRVKQKLAADDLCKLLNVRFRLPLDSVHLGSLTVEELCLSVTETICRAEFCGWIDAYLGDFVTNMVLIFFFI